MPWTRRQFLLATVTSACAPVSRAVSPNTDRFAEIEKRIGGRVGVFALEPATGRHVAHRPDERFAMCSTFKWVLAAAILARVDRGELSLDERVSYGAADIIEHAPITKEHVADGAMTIDALAHAIVTVSDNTAANLLLAKAGGPAGLTRFVRALGDPTTRLDRVELELNTNAPGDPRDATSPRAMVGLMRQVLCEDSRALSAASRERLLGWLRACDTGKDRLRSGLPAGWIAGDKTGTGQRGAVNDVAIAWPPGRGPILIAVYLSDSAADLAPLVRAHVEIARVVASELSA